MNKGSIEINLSGKTALVTGGGRGIGRAIAECFSGAGATVVVAARTQREIEETAEKINNGGGTAYAIQADVTDNASVEALFVEAEKLTGGIDIAVLNAGGNNTISLLESSNPDSWKNTIDINLTSVFYTARAAIPCLKKRGGGKIIVIGSGAGYHIVKKASAYSSAKAGVHAVVKALAEELVNDNISVNEIVPGPVNTVQFHQAQKDGDSYDPKGEWFKEPGEVATLALYLTSFPDSGPSGQSFSLRRRPLF
jgi:3-oxoacyl-[acyl-carrier protein] reductase